MGYCIFVKPVKTRIKHADKPAALKAIKALRGQETCNDSSGKHFSWVCAREFDLANTLEDMLKEWRWDTVNDADGDIVELHFTGEKYGDDDKLFTALAPFIQAGTQIRFRGEEVLENRIDAKVAEIAGVRHPHRCRINYYGEQCQAGSIAIVYSSNSKPVRVTITQEMLDEAKTQTTSGA